MKPSVVIAFAFVMSCGGGGGGDPDHVTVELVGSRGPAAGVTVLFHGADGAVIDRQVTDAGGVARTAATETTQVTIARPTADVTLLYTYRGVGLGDVIHKRLEDYAQLGDVAVVLPGEYLPTSGYHVATSTYQQSVDVALDETVPIRGADLHGSPPTASVYAWAVDDTDRVQAWSHAEAPQNSPSVTLPPWTATVDPITVEVSAPPPGTTDELLQTYIVVGGQSFDLPSPVDGLDTPIPYPHVDGISGWGVLADYLVDVGSEIRFGATEQRRPSPPDRFSIDLGAVDTLTDLVLGPELARPMLTWSGSIRDADTVMTIFLWTDAADITHQWIIYGDDPGAARIEAPIVPEDAGGPSPSIVNYDLYAAEGVADDGVDGYGDVLAGALDDFDTRTDGELTYSGVAAGL